MGQAPSSQQFMTDGRPLTQRSAKFTQPSNLQNSMPFNAQSSGQYNSGGLTHVQGAPSALQPSDMQGERMPLVSSSHLHIYRAPLSQCRLEQQLLQNAHLDPSEFWGVCSSTGSSRLHGIRPTARQEWTSCVPGRTSKSLLLATIWHACLLL